MASHEREVRTFIEAFNDQELERLAATLHPGVVIVTPRGEVEGREGAMRWARSNPDGALVQRLELDAVEVRGDRALADIRKQWHWRNAADGGLADESPVVLLAEFAEGKIIRWEPYASRDEALARLGSVAPARD
ncbi:nuclear transport factor 2 family protein [Thermoleophilia bacterium SCSIO 60948]|nr:nuclear transport factor 2 family protein [Thermoleophilia bacterium SCSIO 60948]